MRETKDKIHLGKSQLDPISSLTVRSVLSNNVAMISRVHAQDFGRHLRLFLLHDGRQRFLHAFHFFWGTLHKNRIVWFESYLNLKESLE